MKVLLTPETLESLVGRGVRISICSGAILLRRGPVYIALKPDFWRNGAICFRIVRGKIVAAVLSVLGIVPLKGGRLCLDFSKHYPGIEIEDVRISDGGLLLQITFEGGRELGF